MKKSLATFMLVFWVGGVSAATYNNITLQGELASTDTITGVNVNVLSGADVIPCSDVSLIPDTTGFFSTQTYISDSKVFLSGGEYILRLSTGTDPNLHVISSFTLTAVPFAQTVRGDKQTGDENVFGAYGNVGIGTTTPSFRLVVSSGTGPILWVSSTGVHATKFYGDGSGLMNLPGSGIGGGGTVNYVPIWSSTVALGNSNLSEDAAYIYAHKPLYVDSNYVYVSSRIVLSDTYGDAAISGANAANNIVINLDANAGHYSYLNSGNFGIGTATPNNKLQVAGLINFEDATSGTFLGKSAGASNTGAENTFIGYQAGKSNQSGAWNTLIGKDAGYNNNSGSANTAVGNGAGYGLTSGTSNTLVGYGVGSTVLQAGTANILIGIQAGLKSDGSNNIVIGAYQQAPQGNYSLNIGGVVFGDLASKTIGISTQIPGAALDVVSTGTAINQFAQIWRTNSGVISSMSATGVMMASKFVGDGSGLTGLSSSGGDNLGNHIATTTLNMASNDIVGADSITAASVTVTGNAFSVGGATLVATSGKIGIGTSSPAGTLHIQDGQVVTISSSTVAEGYNIQRIITNKGQMTIGVARTAGNSIMIGELPNSGGITTVGSYPLQLGTNELPRLTILDTSGNVGIGDSAPTAKLVVNGNVVSSGTIYAQNGFYGAGSGVTSLNASNLASGTVADARLSSNVDLLNTNQTLSGAKTFNNSVTVSSLTVTAAPTFQVMLSSTSRVTDSSQATSVTPVCVAGSTTTITLSRASNVMFMYNGIFSSNQVGFNYNIAILRDGATVMFATCNGLVASLISACPLIGIDLNVPAGKHEWCVQISDNGGGISRFTNSPQQFSVTAMP